MDLITAKCPDCGAQLKIAPGALNAVCEYCGSNVLVTDVLGSGAVVQNCMTLAYSAMEGENYKDGYDHFSKALEYGVNNYNAWFGKAICTGMMSRMMDVRFDEMIVLFENAFKHAPADKQVNLKRNAAEEIVKAAGKMSGRIHAGDDLLSITSEPGETNVFSQLSGNTNNMKNEVMRALAKAREYDPSNNDVLKLQSDIGSTIRLTTGYPPVLQPEYPTLKEVVSGPQSQPKIYGRKNNGCVAIIFAFIIIAGISIAIYLFSMKTGSITKFNEPQKLPQKQVYIEPTAPYIYTIVKTTDSKGTLYISLYSDTQSDENLNSINEEVLKKYKDKGKNLIVNYYLNKKDAQKNSSLQINHNKDWIVKNADAMNLVATSEYYQDTGDKNFYRYENDDIVAVKQK